MTTPVLRAADVAHGPERTFAMFTDHIGAWWPLATHGLFGTQGTVGFEDGRLVERSLRGDECVWAEATTWEPPHRLVLQWHPGRGTDEASEVEVRFIATETGTRVEIEHRSWERFGVDAAQRRSSYAGPSAWGFVLDHFAHLAEPSPGAREGLADLATAYDAFFAEAEAGGFFAPSDGGWDAAQTIAHVALNDIAMAAVARDLINRGEPAFENQTCQDHAVLDALVARCGTFEELVAFARAQSRNALDLSGRLNEEQLAAPVPCHLTHDGDVVLDRPMPWGQIAIVTQAARHLPAHVEQLTKLRFFGSWSDEPDDEWLPESAVGQSCAICQGQDVAWLHPLAADKVGFRAFGQGYTLPTFWTLCRQCEDLYDDRDDEALLALMQQPDDADDELSRSSLAAFRAADLGARPFQA
ncbi:MULTISPECIES: SRPBCC domain-containing protein [unclassified Nocardioides]|uniref:SRPBCC domain-containing protein n=1 Tax=unclassified Nocardioides TaxID=2615069 RepID=UPI0007027C71|nr:MULTISPECIES: SRPBCC domain-containing protein [unclassified Nocardioides]KQZ68801.1 hypothetical protein ASD66_16180 [Nocardioides sp. Root151]KRF11931.1 hypothetical protein ASH02_18415 [Nocardioides sp. Soil796]